MGWRDRYLTKDTLTITEVPAKALSKSKSVSTKKYVYNDEYRLLMKSVMKQVHAQHPEIAEKIAQAHTGKKRPPEVGAKIAATRRANGSYKHTDETRNKLSKINTGIKRGPISAETAAKISQALTGKKRTDDTRQQMSDSARLRVQRLKELGHAPPAGKPIMTPNGVFSSATEVSRVAGVSMGRVYHWMKKWPEHYYYIETTK